MKPLDDRELTTLLRKWEAPSAPATLRIPSGNHRPSSLRRTLQWLWRGSIRVPTPVGVAIAIIVVVAGVRFSHSPDAPVRELPRAVVPVPVIKTPAIENNISAPAQDSNNASAVETKVSRPAAELPPSSPELAGFRPVPSIEPRVIGAMR